MSELPEIKGQASSPGAARPRQALPAAVTLPAASVQWWHLVAAAAGGAVTLCPQVPGTRGKPRLSLSWRLSLGKRAGLLCFLVSCKWRDYVFGLQLGKLLCVTGTKIERYQL